MRDQQAGHEHEHGHGHGHGHEHDHRHERGGLWARVRHAVGLHSHSHDSGVDLEGSAEGLRTLWISLAVLGATACAQAVVVALSGSVALLGDALHNSADALTAVPLGIAFLLGRRRPTRRYTYGYGRAEDLAGVVIVGVILLSSAAAVLVAVSRLLHPHPVTHLVAVAVAAALGFAGNEVVAHYRIRTGRRIGSAALVADGLHARTDGYTSLAVLAGAGGVAIGWTWADPVVGLLITAAILAVGWQAAREVGRRLMDSVDPALTEKVEAILRATPGVLAVGQVRLRWIGHALRAECEIGVDPRGSVVQAHDIAEHALIHAVPRLTAALVHADPLDDTDHHAPLADHAQADHALAGLDPGQDPGQQRAHPAGRGPAGLDDLGVGQPVPGQARRQVRNQRDAEHFGPHLAGGNRLQTGRHADQVGAEPGQHGDLGRGLVVRTGQHRVDALGQARVGIPGQRPQPGRVQVGQVHEPLADWWRGPGQRGRAGQVQVIADQHRLADAEPGPDPARRVGQHHGPAARRYRRAHAVHHGGRRKSLVHMHPAEEHQDPQRSRGNRAHRGGVTRHRRPGKPAEFGQWDLRLRDADHVGGGRPARAENDRDVMRPGLGGEAGGAGCRGGVRIVGHEGHHGA
jgi:cation diffusion facilitator family transporter